MIYVDPSDIETPVSIFHDQDGFGLARPSNTTPVVVLRFEADTQAGLERIQSEFRVGLLKAMPGATLPF
jgi:phosphomannomutase/phosphoglucomutase